ncbi:extracellular solute-binding protein [Isoptericola halotolerans]|uniref:Multiple sugar transport system substrate-binding protein/putative aldouronate transport system substrate-binding protein n=1 Tax=Isoptericola halotolerans TaxID=300560 RepID=A0ABX2A4G6_9MICO|nr:extracellular solute-binding protein [Isoptericola halotolerans]NOV97703.1 multiple sugar transport system substrate-binding protein/putative aldouronate transport system substrate-binding protein [Isoptericola halotolerans]
MTRRHAGRTGRNRRLAAGTAAMTSAALVLAACSSGSTGGDGGGDRDGDGDTVALECAQDSEADAQFTAAEATSLGILWTDWPDYPIKDSWQIFDEIENRTNVRLETTNIPFSDAEEKRGLLISAGDAPPLVPLIYTGDEQQYAASGAVLPLSDYAEYMPNFQKYVEEWELGEMVENLRQADGKYYMTPGLQEVSVPVFTLLIRKDVFDEVGAPVPDTWDELREGLRLIKEAYPDSRPLADGFEGQSMLNYAAHAFGTVAGWGFGNGMFYDEQTDAFEYAPTTEGYKNMVEYFHGLVEDGLLDTESFTEQNDGMGTVQEKFANEVVFAASGAAGTVQEFGSALKAAQPDAEFEIVQLPPPGGDAGAVVEPRNFWNGFMITSEAADDPDLCTYIQFADWLYYNQDAREMLQWGIEGETYTKDADGTITLNPEYKYESYNINTDEGSIDIKADLGWANDVLAGSTESRSLKESYNPEQFVDYLDVVTSTRTPREPFPPAPLTEDELERASLMATPLKDTVDTATLQFILGQRDMSEWDDFVTQLDGQGLPAYVELINEAKDRFAENQGS